MIPLTLHLICAWCGRTIRAGSPGAETSHGLCATCQARLNAEIDAMAAQCEQDAA